MPKRKKEQKKDQKIWSHHASAANLLRNGYMFRLLQKKKIELFCTKKWYSRDPSLCVNYTKINFLCATDTIKALIIK